VTTGPAGPAAGPAVGAELELDVLRVAPGGHCVGRHEGRVVFVRHALPGERVRAAVTEEHPGYLRADAVAILRPSPDRVVPPCRYAGPGGCGGCDWQHATPTAQRALKAATVTELLTRLGQLPAATVEALDITVEPLPGGLLDWRTRVRYAVDAAGRPGLHAHRSHRVIPVDECLIATPTIRSLPVTGHTWPPDASILTTATSTHDTAVLLQQGTAPPQQLDLQQLDLQDHDVVAGVTELAEVGGVTEVVGERAFRVPADGFWQVHPAAPAVFSEAVLEMLAPVAGERALDLYGGAGLFSVPLAEAVGRQGRVTMVESGRAAAAAARHNLAGLPQVRTVAGRVEKVLPRLLAAEPVDIAVLDPPRTGAGRDVVALLTGTTTRANRANPAGGPARSNPAGRGKGDYRRMPALAGVRRAVCYVACDPAAFARDVRAFTGAGWRLARLRVFDAFPMTQHVECVGLFLPG
jgi:tRNA/tmRNA/rRNA uracil-C5-methylase (TrmA/RlmC/RlmD family)